jgi:hypothetical protein
MRAEAVLIVIVCRYNKFSVHDRQGYERITIIVEA